MSSKDAEFALFQIRKRFIGAVAVRKLSYKLVGIDVNAQ